ncbi:hypothetical protein [Mumia sp. Pv 4-285]|uniref:hypothetical protein n=1 Tax=Mumia qirimensis TaxID=3234852 RepID=UPI00351D88C6
MADGAVVTLDGEVVRRELGADGVEPDDGRILRVTGPTPALWASAGLQDPEHVDR